MTESPKRGDVVTYKGKFYFYRSSGTMCYLFRYEEELGIKLRAVGKTASWNVKKAGKQDAIRYRVSHLKVPRLRGVAKSPQRHEEVIVDVPEDRS